MSRDMIRHDSFTDASGLDMIDLRIARVPPCRFNGPDNSLIIPAFHLVHLESGVKPDHRHPHQVEGIPK